MIIVTTLLLNLALFSPCLSIGSMPIHHDYTRFADVERHCQSVLSSAVDAELNADAGRGSRLMYQLSFMNGDWSQDAGQAPLLPFHGSYADPAVAAGPDDLPEAVPLASFRLTHMETVPRRGARAAFNVSGVLTLSIARDPGCSWELMEMEPSPSPPEFELRPGIARLHLVFRGPRDRDDGGGERVLCMVGDALLPVRGSNSTDPWDWAKNDGAGTNLEPPVLSDGKHSARATVPEDADADSSRRAWRDGEHERQVGWRVLRHRPPGVRIRVRLRLPIPARRRGA